MPKATAPKITPAMEQFFRFKKQHPECVLFFRMGDFYEMFYDDAKVANKVLGITLTQRSKGVPMAGVPFHSVGGYLRRMIQAGYRVAICDQVEDPKQAKGVVKRDITRIITPGTLTDESLLQEGRENPLAAVQFHSDSEVSLAWAELSTGTFSIMTLPTSAARDELSRIAPRELLYVETADGKVSARVQEMAQAVDCLTVARPAWHFRLGEARELLCKQYEVSTLLGFGLEDADPNLGVAAAIVQYLLETQCAASEHTATTAKTLAHLQPPKLFKRDQYLVIDQVSLRSLEVEQTMRSGSTKGSLLDILQGSVTPMGKRRLRHWLCYPLNNRKAIEQRQRVVGAMIEDVKFLDAMCDALDQVQDVQRISSRVAVGRATPRDLVGLGQSSAKINDIERLLADRPAVAPYQQALRSIVGPLAALALEIAAVCNDQPPAHMRDGGLVRDGYDTELDEYRSLQKDGTQWLAAYQKKLAEETGISTLKIGYNKVFGFYIEVTAAHRDKAPDNWTRKQTLKNAERYITPELKTYEGKVLTAQDHAITCEQVIFAKLCDLAHQQLGVLNQFADTVADLDVLGCFAKRAIRFRYICPTLVDEPTLVIQGGRHPVLDELLGDRFVPNDVQLHCMQNTKPAKKNKAETENGNLAKAAQSTNPQATLALITGPNMAGKSTYIRQTALLTLLAHTGSFVPAESAVIGLCDRIFTRIGASDELHTGQSTFMVEMTETANICLHATEKSLVILDEIGRGTSTLDGLSLAWAIAEHLATKRCRCLFATHYHEITQLSEQYENITNLNVTVREWQDQIVFLHRILAGATNRSYGTHVAKIAGLPRQVIDRANQLMTQLEVSHITEKPAMPRHVAPQTQMSLFTEYIDHPIISELKEADLNKLTPLEAFDLLRQLQEKI